MEQQIFLGFAGVWGFRGDLHRSPGQGFLVFAGVWFLAMLAEHPLSSLDGYRETVLLGGPSPPRYTGFLLWNRFQTGILATVAITSAFIFADSYCWRIALVLAAIGPVESVLTCVGWDFFQDRGNLVAPADTFLANAKMLEQVSYPTTAMALLWATLRDRKLGVSRDWTHWYGIALWCCFYGPLVLGLRP